MLHDIAFLRLLDVKMELILAQAIIPVLVSWHEGVQNGTPILVAGDV